MASGRFSFLLEELLSFRYNESMRGRLSVLSRLVSVSSRVFIAAVSLLALASCAKKSTAARSGGEAASDGSERVIVGFSQIGAESAWRIYNSKDMQAAAQNAGIQLLYTNAEQKQENQIKAIRTFIMYQVDVIVFVPIVQDGWGNVLEEAREAGIPVIVCDRKINAEYDGLYAGYVGTDSWEEGRQAARFLFRKYEGFSGTVNIFELRGTDGASASDGRIEGFRELLASDPRFRIICSESGDFMRSRGEEIARNILAGGSRFAVNGEHIDAVFSCNDGMTLGLLDALDQQGIQTGTGSPVTIVTVDAQQEAIDRLKAGRINCVVECNPEQGAAVMDLAKRLAAGLPIPLTTIVSGRVFTEYDDLSDLPERKY